MEGSICFPCVFLGKTPKFVKILEIFCAPYQFGKISVIITS